jgi:hypothetical protein
VEYAAGRPLIQTMPIKPTTSIDMATGMRSISSPKSAIRPIIPITVEDIVYLKNEDLWG